MRHPFCTKPELCSALYSGWNRYYCRPINCGNADSSAKRGFIDRDWKLNVNVILFTPKDRMWSYLYCKIKVTCITALSRLSTLSRNPDSRAVVNPSRNLHRDCFSERLSTNISGNANISGSAFDGRFKVYLYLVFDISAPPPSPRSLSGSEYIAENILKPCKV